MARNKIKTSISIICQISKSFFITSLISDLKWNWDAGGWADCNTFNTQKSSECRLRTKIKINLKLKLTPRIKRSRRINLFIGIK